MDTVLDIVVYMFGIDCIEIVLTTASNLAVFTKLDQTNPNCKTIIVS